jgi:hypothetical protein
LSAAKFKVDDHTLNNDRLFLKAPGFFPANHFNNPVRPLNSFGDVFQPGRCDFAAVFAAGVNAGFFQRASLARPES